MTRHRSAARTRRARARAPVRAPRHAIAASEAKRSFGAGPVAARPAVAEPSRYIAGPPTWRAAAAMSPADTRRLRLDKRARTGALVGNRPAQTRSRAPAAHSSVDRKPALADRCEPATAGPVGNRPAPGHRRAFAAPADSTKAQAVDTRPSVPASLHRRRAARRHRRSRRADAPNNRAASRDRATGSPRDWRS